MCDDGIVKKISARDLDPEVCITALVNNALRRELRTTGGHIEG